MAQNTFPDLIADDPNGLALAQYLNGFRDALQSLHLGASRPAYAEAGMLWAQDDNGTLKVFLHDGTSDHLIAKWDNGNGLQINGDAVDRFTSALDGAVPAPGAASGVLGHDGSWFGQSELVGLGVSPVSIAGAGVGQVTRLFAPANSILYAPAGGTWECNWHGEIVSTGNISQGGYVVVAGGTALGGPAAGLSLHGFAKRIA